MSAQTTAEDKAVRLFTLLVLLSAGRRPKTRAEVFERMTAFYPPGREARERMFERDKDDLRNIGVVIDAIEDVENEELIGYRVNYQQTQERGISFTPEESLAVSLAARLWEGTRAAASVEHAALQVDAIGGGPVETWLEQALRFTPMPEPVELLTEAMRSRSRVEFSYLKPADATPARREIEPWSVTALAGRWYLLGLDTAAAAGKTFRLDRIVGPVTLASAAGAYSPPPNVDVAAMLQGPGDAVETPIVLVRRGTCHRLRQDSVAIEQVDAQWDRCTLPARNEQRLARLVAGYGADAKVAEPVTLRAQVRSILEAASGGQHAH